MEFPMWFMNRVASKKQIPISKYGSVQIVIQDGKVVQIESTEKIRLDQPQAKGGSGKKWTPST
jgi:hypothetical protein